MRALRNVAALTILFGAGVVIAWLGIGGATAAQGGFVRVIEDSGVVLYGLIALLAAVPVFLLVRVGWLDRALVILAATVFLAWTAELACLVVLFARSDPDVHRVGLVSVWLVATGFGLQPLAGWLGGVVSRGRPTERAT